MFRNSVLYAELKRFGQQTSAKGVGRAIKSENHCLKVMWTTAITVLLIVTVFNVVNLTMQFLRYPAGTKITEKKIDLVADTGSDILLCNINPFSSLAMNRTLELQIPYRNLIHNWTAVLSESSAEERRTLSVIREELLSGNSGFFQSVGFQESASLSHSWENFVFSCHVHYLDGVMEKTLPCSFTNMNVKQYQHKKFFNCFKIHGKASDGNTVSTAGMSFLLYVDSVDDSSSFTRGRGALLTIGESGTLINPETHGLEILPNFVNVIRFRPIHRRRLPEPYGNCLSRQHTADRNESKFHLPYLYTDDACLSACIEYNIIQTCQCQDVGQHGTLLQVFNNVSMCGATEEGREVLINRMQCAQKWRSSFRRKCLPQCPPPCVEKMIDKSVTYLEMSHSEIQTQLSREQSASTVPQLNDVFSAVIPDPRNFARVHLKRQRASYYLIEDTKAMTISDYLAKIGGAMNLWSGITVFILIEIADFVCRVLKGSFEEKGNFAQNRPRATAHDSSQEDQHPKGDILGDRYTQQYGSVNSVFKYDNWSIILLLESKFQNSLKHQNLFTAFSFFTLVVCA